MTVSLVKANPIVNAVRFYLSPRKGLTSMDIVEYADGTVVRLSRRSLWNLVDGDTRLRRSVGKWSTDTFESWLNGARENEKGSGAYGGERTIVFRGTWVRPGVR